MDTSDAAPNVSSSGKEFVFLPCIKMVVSVVYVERSGSPVPFVMHDTDNAVLCLLVLPTDVIFDIRLFLLSLGYGVCDKEVQWIIQIARILQHLLSFPIAVFIISLSLSLSSSPPLSLPPSFPPSLSLPPSLAPPPPSLSHSPFSFLSVLPPIF